MCDLINTLLPLSLPPLVHSFDDDHIRQVSLKRLNELTMVIQDQFAHVEELEGSASISHRGIVDSINSIEAGAHRLQDLLNSPGLGKDAEVRHHFAF